MIIIIHSRDSLCLNFQTNKWFRKGFIQSQSAITTGLNLGGTNTQKCFLLFFFCCSVEEGFWTPPTPMTLPPPFVSLDPSNLEPIIYEFPSF